MATPVSFYPGEVIRSADMNYNFNLVFSSLSYFLPPMSTSTELTVVAAFGPTQAGTMWFNTTEKQFKGWNGTSTPDNAAGIIILG